MILIKLAYFAQYVPLFLAALAAWVGIPIEQLKLTLVAGTTTALVFFGLYLSVRLAEFAYAQFNKDIVKAVIVGALLVIVADLSFEHRAWLRLQMQHYGVISVN